MFLRQSEDVGILVCPRRVQTSFFFTLCAFQSDFTDPLSPDRSYFLPLPEMQGVPVTVERGASGNMSGRKRLLCFLSSHLAEITGTSLWWLPQGHASGKRRLTRS